MSEKKSSLNLQINVLFPEGMDHQEEILEITSDLINKLSTGKYGPTEVESVIQNVVSMLKSISSALGRTVTRQEILLYLADRAAAYDKLDDEMGPMRHGETRVLPAKKDPFPDAPSVFFGQHVNVNLDKLH